MNTESPLQRVHDFARGERLDSAKLSSLGRAITRMNAGVNAPTQSFKPQTGVTGAASLPSQCRFALTDSTVSQSGTPVIDSVQSVANNLVLVQLGNQQDGVYKIPASGFGAWSRIAKFNVQYTTAAGVKDNVPVFPYGALIGIYDGASAPVNYMVVSSSSSAAV